MHSEVNNKKWGFPFFVNPNICVSDLGIMAQQVPIVYISENVCICRVHPEVSLPNLYHYLEAMATLIELVKIMEIFTSTQTIPQRTPLKWLEVVLLINYFL